MVSTRGGKFGDRARGLQIDACPPTRRRLGRRRRASKPTRRIPRSLCPSLSATNVRLGKLQAQSLPMIAAVCHHCGIYMKNEVVAFYSKTRCTGHNSIYARSHIKGLCAHTQNTYIRGHAAAHGGRNAARHTYTCSACVHAAAHAHCPSEKGGGARARPPRRYSASDDAAVVLIVITRCSGSRTRSRPCWGIWWPSRRPSSGCTAG